MEQRQKEQDVAKVGDQGQGATDKAALDAASKINDVLSRADEKMAEVTAKEQAFMKAWMDWAKGANGLCPWGWTLPCPICGDMYRVGPPPSMTPPESILNSLKKKRAAWKGFFNSGDPWPPDPEKDYRNARAKKKG